MIIKIGTDCSGIEAPIQALKQLNVQYSHEFSSEIDKYAIESIKANYDPKIIYDDMTVKRKLPHIDMYVCGFPCQPFSLAGNRLGLDDPRGNIFKYCIKTIEYTTPSLFILENVKGIITIDNGSYFQYIKNSLNKLKEYEISYFILNTKDYGIPQNRERLFIVGLNKSKIKKKLQCPKKTKCKPIKSYIDEKTTMTEEYCDTFKNKYHLFKNGTFVDIATLRQTSSIVNPNYSSTLSTQALWCIPKNRKATIKECLLLQGFPKNFKQIVSNSQMRKQIGNSMSVNVLKCLFKECFISLEWI